MAQFNKTQVDYRLKRSLADRAQAVKSLASVEQYAPPVKKGHEAPTCWHNGQVMTIAARNASLGVATPIPADKTKEGRIRSANEARVTKKDLTIEAFRNNENRAIWHGEIVKFAIREVVAFKRVFEGNAEPTVMQPSEVDVAEFHRIDATAMNGDPDGEGFPYARKAGNEFLASAIYVVDRWNREWRWSTMVSIAAGCCFGRGNDRRWVKEGPRGYDTALSTAAVKEANKVA